MLNPEMLKNLRADIDRALEQVAKNHGLDVLRAGNATYDGSAGNFSFKLEGRIAGGLSKEATRYNQIRGFQNLPELGFSFRSGADRFEVCGCNATGTKILAKSQGNGKTYQFPVASIHRAVAIETSAAVAK